MKSTFLFLFTLILSLGLNAQAPQSFSYQAVARDLAGKALSNTTVSFRVSILSGSTTGTVVYSETHSGKTTNALGLVELEIGKGTVNAGSFSAISWGSNTFFLKMEMDPAGGTAYQDLGTSQLLSVPYALYSLHTDDSAIKGYIDSLLERIEVIEGTKVKDGDGNIYGIVKIGTQDWMTKNLKTTKYNDGVSITNVTDGDTWSALTTGAYCWYNNDKTSYENPYGAFYNWFAVNTGKLCPSGWHVPSENDWTILATYLGGEAVAGGKMKEVGTSHWKDPNVGATNESRFTAVPGGHRHGSDGGFFDGVHDYGIWWSVTPTNDPNVRHVALNSYAIELSRSSLSKPYGFSVRCVRD
jgi:uncharacterized protein (TIGR02145 family)